jgi:hypothetical protein
MDDNKHSHITNILVLLAVVCVLSYDYLGTYKLVALGIGLSASLVGTILYFQRYWNTSVTQEPFRTRDLVDINPPIFYAPAMANLESQEVELASIPDDFFITSHYAACGNSIEELMVRSQQLHQDVISNLLVQLEKSNWETETAKRLWINLDYAVAPMVSCNSVSLSLSLDGRLVSRRLPAGKQARSKTPSSQWSIAQSPLYQ